LGRDEGAHDLESLDRAALLLTLGRPDRLAKRLRLGAEVEVAEEVADRLRSHPATEVDAEAVRRAEAILQLPEEHLVVDDLLRLAAGEQRLLDAVDVLPDGALLRAARLRSLLEERRERLADLRRGRRYLLELAAREVAVLTDRRRPDELANLLRVLRRDLRGDVLEHAADERPGLVEGREALLLRPGRETARPE